MMNDFDRKIRVTFEGLNISPVEKLRVSFEVDKSDHVQMNHGLIRIYNLKPSSRAELAQAFYLDAPLADPVTKCTLHVGYGEELFQLIEGDILAATNQRIGPDWITDIEIYTGISGAQRSDVQVSFANKTKAKKIIGDLLASMNFDIQYTEEATTVLADKTVSDFSDSGLSFYKANEFLARYDLACTIEDNSVVLVYAVNLPIESQRSQKEANTFNKLNGLIGTPKVTRTGAEFRSLLRPSIRVLQRIYLESQTINETLQNEENFTNEYFVSNVKHIGDTHSNDWFTNITAAYVGLNESVY